MLTFHSFSNLLNLISRSPNNIPLNHFNLWGPFSRIVRERNVNRYICYPIFVIFCCQNTLIILNELFENFKDSVNIINRMNFPCSSRCMKVAVSNMFSQIISFLFSLFQMLKNNNIPCNNIYFSKLKLILAIHIIHYNNVFQIIMTAIQEPTCF